MHTENKISHSRLRELVTYDPNTGHFTWKVSRSPKSRAGTRVGTIDAKGYVRIVIDGFVLLGHRLAWFYIYAEWPTSQVEHRNGDLRDNRQLNLKLKIKGAEKDVHLISRERLRELLHYDAITGKFTWKVTLSNRAAAGEVAGVVTKSGYRYIRVAGHTYLAHRLAWFYETGEWPPHKVDHKNRSRDDNWLDNLRLATNAQNCWNAGPKRSNTSGFKGVSWSGAKKLWTARIYQNYHLHVLGYFRTKEAAAAAYEEAAKRLHGEFASPT